MGGGGTETQTQLRYRACSLYSFSRAFRTACLLGYFNVDVIDSLIGSSGFIITPFMVTDRKA